MKNLSIFLTLFVGVVAPCFAITVELEGSPQGGESVADAPIYTLNGEANSTLVVDGNVQCEQSLVFSMDNVNSGNVRTVGSMHLTAPDWDAWFDANSLYVIKSYGSLVQVTFNHKLKKDSLEECLIDGQVAATGEISSVGYMILVSDDFSFVGGMRGIIKAWSDVRKSKVIINRPYPSSNAYGDTIVIFQGKKYCTFTQDFTDIVLEDQGVWSASYDFSVLAKGKLSGTGTITVGPQDDPVDEVAQKVSGTRNTKTGIYSWTTTSNSRADAKVKVTIKHTDTDVVDNANSVSAAAQTRKF